MSLIIVGHHSGYRLGTEEKLAQTWGHAQGWAVRMAALSQLERKRVDTGDAALVVGSIPFTRAALRHWGIDMPVINCYPPSLEGLLRRRVLTCSLRDALHRVDRGEALFVKPAKRLKRFTGRSKTLRTGGSPACRAPRLSTRRPP